MDFHGSFGVFRSYVKEQIFWERSKDLVPDAGSVSNMEVTKTNEKNNRQIFIKLGVLWRRDLQPVWIQILDP